MDALHHFHPAVRAWFERRFDAATDAQARGWDAIARGQDALIAAPTGSGKTLTAFLYSINSLLCRGLDGALPDGVDVIYVSPLKALSGDIQRNLEEPLAGIDATARELGFTPPEIRTALRTGDTTPAARAAILRHAPHILITTPESLYLMLTAERSRALLRNVRTVIVDELHALMRDKRGSHLALSLARLDALCEQRPLRIGLSATVHPIEEAARFLVGSGRDDERGAPRCTVVNVGHHRDMDLLVEVPPTDLAAVATHEQWSEIYDRVAELIAEHRTTLVFVNTRRLAERVAHNLGERLGAGARRRSPRQPLERPPPARRAAPEGRRDAGDRRHRLAGAGHRRRLRRPRLPDRLAARDRDVPAAHRPLRSRARAHVPRPPVRHDARRADRMRRARPRRPRRPPRSRRAAGRAARHPGAADRRRVRDARLGRGRTLRPGAHRRAVCRAHALRLRRRGRDAQRRRRAAASGAARRCCIATASTARSAAAAPPASPRSPPAAPSRRWPTTASCSTPTRRTSAP